MFLFGGSIFLDFAVFLATCLFVFYAYAVRSLNKWMEKGIPVSDPSFLLGNMKDVMLRKITMGENVREVYLKNRHKPYVTFLFFMKPLVMINDLELAKKILIKDFQHFADRHSGVSQKDPLMYYNMFFAKGQFWKQLRVKLSPTFTSGKLKKMFELVDFCGKRFVDHLAAEKDSNGVIEMKEASARFTSDVIQSTAFGLEGDALVNKDSAFRNIMKQIFTPDFIIVLKMFCAFMFPSVIERLGIVTTKTIVAEYCRQTVWKTVEYREKHGIKRNDFLDLLLQLRKKGHLDQDEEDEDSSLHKDNVDGSVTKKDIELDGDVLVAQCFLFMAAGFDTSARVISWALYELSLQPDLQERLHKEITQVLEKHGGHVTYDAVHEMPYLHMVLFETLRKYPVVFFLDRKAMTSYRIPGTSITLDRDQGVLIPVMGIHYDPDIYPEPDKFDPERFTPENVQHRPPCAFLGFGEGPRNCIGTRMGLLQTKVGLIYLLTNFSVSPCDKTPIPVVLDVSDSPIGGLPLRLTKRSSV